MNKVLRLYPERYYKDKAKEYFEQGVSYVIEENYSTAYHYFAEAARLEPDEAQYHFYSGITAFYFQDKSAVEHLKNAAIKDMENPEYQMWYGISLFRQGEYAEAKKVLIYAHSLDQKNEQIVEYLAKTLNKLEEYAEVTEIITNEVGEDNASPETLYELGYSYMQEVEYDKAIQVLKKCIKSNPKNALAYFTLSRAYMKTGEFDEAIDILNKLKEEDETQKELAEKNIEAIQFLKSF